MANPLAAKRYARALFELAQEQAILEAVQADISLLDDLLAGEREWLVLSSPYVITAEARKKFFRTLFTDRVHPLTLRFLIFLVDKGRHPLLREILRQFRALNYAAQGIVAVRILSAYPLDPGQRDALVKKIEAHLGKQVAPTLEVDPALLAGFQVRVEDRVFDCSVNHQLNRVYRALVAA